MNSVLSVLADNVRILTFRSPSPAIALNWRGYLLVGLVITWVVGIGRYWDNPRADLWQQVGMGSVLYVFFLALIVWIILLPLKPARWSYRNVLVFLTMTSLPALLYAIPVERFMALGAAQTVNAWFLAVVATWRVALFAWFLRVVSRLSWPKIAVGTLLPITLIIVALSLLNLEHVVFDIMAGVDPASRSPNDIAYGVVFWLSMLSMMAFPILVVTYLWLAVVSRQNR